MKSFIALIALLLSTEAFATTGRTVQADVIEGAANVLVNPSFDRATYNQNWTVTTVTGAKETSTIAPGAGKQSAKLTYSSQTGGISQSLVPAGNTTSVNMEATCKVNTTMTTIEVCSLAGGSNQNCQAVPASGTWQTVSASLIGPTNGTSVGVKVDTTSSGSGTVYVDDCYVGPARNLGTGTFATPWTSTTLTPSAGFGTTTLGSFQYRRVADTLHVKGYFKNGTVAASVGSIPMPTGLTIDSTKATSTASVLRVGTYQRVPAGATISASTSGSFSGPLFYDGSDTSNIYFAYQSGTNALIKDTISSFMSTNDGISIDFSVPVTQFTDQSFFRADSTPASWTGYHDSISGGCSTTSATYTDVSACTGIALHQLTSRNVTCSTASGSLPGITCTFPRGGIWHFCATPNAQDASIANPSFRMVDGSSNIINQGISATIAVGNAMVSPQVCGDINMSGAGTATAKLLLATDVATVKITQGTASGSAAIMWEVNEKDAPMAAPFFTGSVSSSSTTQGFRLESAAITNNGTTATIASQSGSWLSSSTRTAAGKVSFVVATGEFSAAPWCWCSASVNPGTTAGNCLQDSTVSVTTTAFGVASQNSTTGSLQDQNFNVFCMGVH